MEQDVFMEYMVKKDATITDQIKKCGILLGALLIIAVCVIFLGSQYLNMLAAALGVCAGWVAIILLKLLRVEYEYIITDGELDIDKIQGKSKRTRLVTLEISSFTSFEKLNPQNPVDAGGRIKILAAKNLKSEETYLAMLNHKELGDCILYFTPNEQMVEYIERARKTKRVYVPSMGK